MIEITQNIFIADNELEFSAIRAQGSGGQNVNKVSSAIHLRFDINASSLAEFYKQRLLALQDKRITKTGVIIIKCTIATLMGINMIRFFIEFGLALLLIYVLAKRYAK